MTPVPEESSKQIAECLANRTNFMVEAGAGAGKTTSLMEAILWLKNNRRQESYRIGKTVVCITYTNVAADVIKSRLSPNDNFVLPCTIHSFAWQAIKRFKKTLIHKAIVEHMVPDEPELGSGSITDIKYDLGQRDLNNGMLSISHDDVIRLFSLMLDNEKFRRIFSDTFPIILVDEYQDSNKSVMEKFLQYFIVPNVGPQFGLFGDSWQAIYKSLDAIGNVSSEGIKVIKKQYNFRSAPEIITFLNQIRPDLQQVPGPNNQHGMARVIHCNDFIGQRDRRPHHIGDLPISELKRRLEELTTALNTEQATTFKTLMLTHRMLSEQQGYANILNILGNGFKQETDCIYKYAAEVIEPLRNIAVNGKSSLSSVENTILRGEHPINSIADKEKWRTFLNALESTTSTGTIKSVLDCVIASNLLHVPDAVKKAYSVMIEATDTTLICSQEDRYRHLADVDYSELRHSINFMRPESIFSTDHGVKGEEYDNILFVIGRGWNQYEFDKYVPMVQNPPTTPATLDVYERNRNLFYVGCSRAKKELNIFVTIKLEGEFKNFLENAVGSDNIIAYPDFLQQLQRCRG